MSIFKDLFPKAWDGNSEGLPSCKTPPELSILINRDRIRKFKKEHPEYDFMDEEDASDRSQGDNRSTGAKD